MQGCDRIPFLNSIIGPKKNQSFMEFCQRPSEQHKKLLKTVIKYNVVKRELKEPFQYNEQSCVELFSLLKKKEYVYIEIPQNVPDIIFIKEFENLSHLKLSIEQEKLDCSPLKELPYLKSLTLLSEIEVNLEFLEGIPNLEKLSLSVEKQSVLSGFTLKKLKHIKLYPGSTSDISFLKNSPKLETISTSGSNIEDLSPISELYNLKSIGFFDDKITDICPIQNLSNLEYASFQRNKISKICSLKKLKKLKSLNLSNNEISEIKSLRGANNLEYLDLVGNKIKDITPISQLKELKQLRIMFNQIEDISPVSSLKQLTDLAFDDNNIKDISSLKRLKNLEFLNFVNNQIEDVSVVKSLPKIRSVAFYGNPIKDYTPVLRFVRQEELQGECTEADVQQGYCTEQQYRLRLAKKRLEIESLTDYFKNNSN